MTEEKPVIKTAIDKRLSQLNSEQYKEKMIKEKNASEVNYLLATGAKRKVYEEVTYKNGVKKRKLKEVWKGSKRIG